MASRVSLSMCLALCACGAPSWPEVAYPSDADVVRFATTPVDPIQGEEIALVLPMLADGRCHAIDAPLVQGAPEQDVVPLVIGEGTSGTCAVVERAASGSQIALGVLPAGRYEVRVGTLSLPFEVRDASTPPGAPPLVWQVAHAVAERNHAPSSCAESDEHVAERPWRLRDPRLHHQVSAAHPDWSEAQVTSAMCIAQSVMIRPISEHEWRYRHSASSLCHTADAIGTVRVHDDGTFEIEAPYIVDGRDVPC